MRTTLDIDTDVLEAAKEISNRTKRSTGKILSELARQSLTSSCANPGDKPLVMNGFEVLPAGDRVVTTDLVGKIRAEIETS